jgi:hypothetical protein
MIVSSTPQAPSARSVPTVATRQIPPGAQGADGVEIDVLVDVCAGFDRDVAAAAVAMSAVASANANAYL